MVTSDILETPLQFLKGVGPRRAVDLAAGEIHVLEDLLLRLPIRYEDRARFQPIAGVQPGESVSVAGTVLSQGGRRTRRRGLYVLEVLLGDSTGQIRIVFFNQPFSEGCIRGLSARDRPWHDRTSDPWRAAIYQSTV